MRKLINSLLMILLLGGISSCGNDLESMGMGHHRAEQMKDVPQVRTVKMSFGGDYVSETEEPLFRAEDANTYVGINVFRTENKTGATEEKYAYGVYTTKEDISVDLLTGFKYRFEATILVDGTDKLVPYNNNYVEPFKTDVGTPGTADLAGVGSYAKDKLNKIYYSRNLFDNKDIFVSNDSRYYLGQLKFGTAYVNTGGAAKPSNTYCYHPRVKRYYGTAEYSCDPWLSEDETSVQIDMRYLSFGLRIELVNGISAGKLIVEDITSVDYRNHQNYTNLALLNVSLDKDNTSCDDIYSLYNLYSAYEKIDVYSEKFKLKFTWKKTDDPSLDEVFESPEIEVHPQKKKILKITLDGEPLNETKGNIIFKLVDDEKLEEEAPVSIGNNKKD